MKRGWFGFALLVLLLVGGVMSTWTLANRYEPMADSLRMAADHGLSSEWEAAQSLTDRVRQQWQQSWHFTAAFVDHAPMEAVDELFSQLEIYSRAKEPLAYASVCAQLHEQLQALSDAQIPTWWNLL